MSTGAELSLRLSKLRELLRHEGLSAFYASKPEDVLYLTGRSAGRVVVTKNDVFLWVRGLYAQLHKKHYASSPYTVFDVEKDPIKRFFKKHRFNCVGVGDGPSSSIRRFRRVSGCSIKVSDALSHARSIKTSFEIRRLKTAAVMASKGVKKAGDLIRAGRREIDVAAEVECFIRKLGSESPPFSEGLLLSSGCASADIHARPSEKKIRRGLVLVDLGGKYKGYYSDVSRTFCVGRPTKRERFLLEFVGNLRDECIDRVSPGVKASELFDYARSEIEKQRLKFYHSLGHGIGLEVHERPNLGPKSRDVLEEGMVFTIEPGVYIPREFGVRFEDTVVLGRNKARKIT